MRELSLKELKKHDSPVADLYLKRGQKIFSQDQPFPPKFFETLELAGVKSLFLVSDDDLDDFKFYAVHQEISLDSPALLKEGQLSQSLYDRQGNLVIESGQTWTKKIAKELRSKNQSFLYQRRSDDRISQDEQAAQRLLEMINKLLPDEEEQSEEKQGEESLKQVHKDKSDLNQLSDQFEPLDKSCFTTTGLDNFIAKDEKSSLPDTENALEKQLKEHPPEEIRDEVVVTKVTNFHKQCVADLRYLLESLALKQNVDMRTLSELSRNTLKVLVEDRELLLNTTYLDSGKMEDFVFSHSVKSAVLSANIATSLGYSAQQVYELAFAAFLHDVGMLKIPREILLKPGKLNESEKSEIYKHPIYALDILQRLPGIPMATPLVAYQSHERGHKIGYPRRKPMGTIHRFARIVAIADVYCAMTSRRPYRAAFGPYAVMEYLTREVVQGHLDRDILKAFMSINSLYPVGSWVILSDGHVGKVIASNPQKYDRPIIRVFFRGTEKLPELKTLDLSEPEHENLRVAKTIDGSRLKVSVMDGF